MLILLILYEKHPPLILSSDSHNGKIESFIKNNIVFFIIFSSKFSINNTASFKVTKVVMF